MNFHCMGQAIQCDSLFQGSVGVVMANGGVMSGAAVTVVAAGAGLAEASDNWFGPCGYS